MVPLMATCVNRKKSSNLYNCISNFNQLKTLSVLIINQSNLSVKSNTL